MTQNNVNTFITTPNYPELTIPAFLRRKKNTKSKKKPVYEDFVPKKVPLVMRANVEPVKPVAKPKKPKVEQVSVQTHIWNKGTAVLSELEGMLDDGIITPQWSLHDFLLKKEISTVIAKRIADHFAPRADELLEVMTMTDDDELQYAYRGYDTDDLTNMTVIYQGFVDEATRYAINAKKIRKMTRKRKLPSVERMLKHFVFAKTDNTYKLASIDPSKIVGAQALWVFNPKNCILTVYRAMDRGGLGIKRTTITNIDEKNSVSKRIGRKTAERLEAVLTGGKVTLRKLMDTITSDQLKLTRITKNHVLLRVE